jgi:hypothetical protein
MSHSECGGDVTTIVWDAMDTYTNGTPVIALRDARLRSPGGAYRILRGLSQDQLPALKFQDGLTQARGATYARVLNIIDTSSGTLAALELRSMRLLLAGGAAETLGFCEAPADTLVLDVPALMEGGRSRPFHLPPDAQRIEMVLSAYRNESASMLFSGDGPAGFQVVLANGDSVIATLAEIPFQSIGKLKRETLLLSFQVPDLSSRMCGQPVCLRPVVHGLRTDRGMTALLGHVHAAPEEVPTDTLTTTVRPIPRDKVLPEACELFQNFPNPCNPATVIRYRISAAGEVNLTVYDILGREVAVLVKERLLPGIYETRFEPEELASGGYFVRMAVGDFVQTRRMAVVN